MAQRPKYFLSLIALVACLNITLVCLMLFACPLFASSEEFRAGRDAWADKYENFKELMAAKRYADAHKIADKVIEEAPLLSPYQDEAIVISLGGIGLEYYKHGIYYEAEPLLEKAVKEIEKLWGKQHELYAGLLEVLGGVRGRLGRYDDAEKLIKEALAIEEATYGPDHPRVAVALFNLGIVCEWRGHYAEAVEFYLKSLAITGNAVSPDDPDLAKTLQALVDVYEKLNEPENAREYQERLKNLSSEKQ